MSIGRLECRTATFFSESRRPPQPPFTDCRSKKVLRWRRRRRMFGWSVAKRCVGCRIDRMPSGSRTIGIPVALALILGQIAVEAADTRSVTALTGEPRLDLRGGSPTRLEPRSSYETRSADDRLALIEGRRVRCDCGIHCFGPRCERRVETFAVFPTVGMGRE